MSGMDGGGLSAEERAEHGRRADSFPAMQLVYSLTDVEILLRRRVAAAEQARDLERFKYEHEHKAAVIYADRAKAAEQRAERVEVVRGWRTYDDGSTSPVERWVRAADGDWVSLDSTRRTSGDIHMDGADPAPREYDDGGPRVREAVERAERDAALLRVLTNHQRRVSAGGPCWCGKWPTGEHDTTWMEHVVAEYDAALEGGDQP